MKQKQSFDVIIIGAGSIGTPTAFYLAQQGLSVLVVDQFASPGQGSNKCAIGGIRATHTHPAKMQLCVDSLLEFSTWQDQYGDDIEWARGGYLFLAFDESIRSSLLESLSIQKQQKMNIQWLEKSEVLALTPSLSSDGLLGGTYSPEDGSASPLKSNNAYYSHALDFGVSFLFRSPVIELITHNQRMAGIKTPSGTFFAPIVINAAGSWANTIAELTGGTLPVIPNSHEAGVTEPIHHFLDPMIVDMRPGDGISNFYFYQHKTGQIIFCSTPEPEIWGFDTRETSQFLPSAARRLLSLIPALKNIKVRRTWRGLYPMTPDGSPLLGWDRKVEGLFIAAGMCGQGFMLGPGIGKLVTRVLTQQSTSSDLSILDGLNPYRSFVEKEVLK